MRSEADLILYFAAEWHTSNALTIWKVLEKCDFLSTCGRGTLKAKICPKLMLLRKRRPLPMLCHLFRIMAAVAQLVEPSIVIRVVAGSSPVGRPILLHKHNTIKTIRLFILKGPIRL